MTINASSSFSGMPDTSLIRLVPFSVTSLLASLCHLGFRPGDFDQFAVYTRSSLVEQSTPVSISFSDTSAYVEPKLQMEIQHDQHDSTMFNQNP